ncbi:MAG: fumarylacetoacetate hydrolase family protein [Flavobacteriaceae bacterium]
MKLCRFNGDRLGLVEDGTIADITGALDPAVNRWPPVQGDPVIADLEGILLRAQALGGDAPRLSPADVRLNSLITAPSKIMAAPANYRAHVEQDTKDPAVDQGVHARALEGMDRPTETLGLFLKANSALAGPGDGIPIRLPGRRCDHEVEIALIIGRTGRNIPLAEARRFVAGYMIGLDMTYRGIEDRSYRKSADGFCLLGPWMATPDEIDDPDDIEFWLAVNGTERQRSSTAFLTVGISELIALASAMYTLHPGDVIMTGTPEGVGPVVAGDTVTAGAAGIGEMTVKILAG